MLKLNPFYLSFRKVDGWLNSYGSYWIYLLFGMNFNKILYLKIRTPNFGELLLKPSHFIFFLEKLMVGLTLMINVSNQVYLLFGMNFTKYYI